MGIGVWPQTLRQPQQGELARYARFRMSSAGFSLIDSILASWR